MSVETCIELENNIAKMNHFIDERKFETYMAYFERLHRLKRQRIEKNIVLGLGLDDLI